MLLKLAGAVLLVLVVVTSAAPSGKTRYFCSKLNPLDNLSLSEFLGSWVRLEMMLFHFGSPDYPDYNFVTGCCLRTDIENITDTEVSGTDSYYLPNGTLYMRDARWTSTHKDKKAGDWKYSAHEPYPLDMEVLVLQAQPSRYYVFATCMTIPQLEAQENVASAPDELGDVGPDELLLVGLNVAVRRNLTLTLDELGAIRDDLKTTLSLQKYNPWEWDTSC